MATNQIHLNVSEETLSTINAAVASGKYKSADEFVSDLVLDYRTEEDALQHFLANEAVAICERMDADPSRGLTPQEVLAKLGIQDEAEAA